MLKQKSIQASAVGAEFFQDPQRLEAISKPSWTFPCNFLGFRRDATWKQVLRAACYFPTRGAPRLPGGAKPPFYTCNNDEEEEEEDERLLEDAKDRVGLKYWWSGNNKRALHLCNDLRAFSVLLHSKAFNKMSCVYLRQRWGGEGRIQDFILLVLTPTCNPSEV